MIDSEYQLINTSLLVVARPILVLVSQLEKMKNENWLLSQDDHVADPKFPELQRELMRLDKVLLCILHLPKKASFH